jgi:type VI secretion system protein ImpH
MDKRVDQLLAELTEHPFAFGFYQALRRLQALDSSSNLGRSVRPRDDRIRLQQEPDLRFSPSAIRSFVPPNADEPGKLTVDFLGLFGPNGPLPLHLTEYARERLTQHKDPTLTAFLNIFHHRLLSLFYRAWAVHQKSVDLDRPAGRKIANYIGSFIGIGSPALAQRDDVDDAATLYFSGRLSAQTRNAEGLSAILNEYFGIPVTLEPFTGQWITVPEADACRLGESPATGQIGSTVIVGSRVWQVQTKFRLRFGPMTLAELQRMLPIHGSFKRLKTWIRNYCGDELFWDVRYVLLASEVPTTQLGHGGYLGWTSWITTRRPAHDAEDLLIDPSLN